MIEDMMDNDYPARSMEQTPVGRESARPGPPLVGATLLAVPFVLFTTFSEMSWFDDEGTLLVGFRSLMEGHRMYDDIYSLYGPLYNAVYGLIYVVLRIPVTHTAGRLIAAGFWLSYTAGFALFCYRLTRSVSAMLFCFLFVLFWLVELMDSPGHPEEMCLLLLAAVLLLTCSIERAHSMAAFTGIGAAVAALALVKINIGAYVGGGVLLVFLRASAPTRWTRIAIPFVAAALLSLPLAVQALLFDFEWVKLYVLFSTMCIGIALLAVLRVPIPIVVRPVDWSIIALAGGLTCLAVIGGMMLAGSSGYAILNAVLLQNAHFIRNWYQPLHLGRQGLAVAAASALAAAAYSASGSRPLMQAHRRLGILVLKCMFVTVGAISMMCAQHQVFPILTPFCWLLIVPPAGDQQIHPVGRSVAGLIGAIMSLYPFPVAGTQINTGALLPVIMVPVLARDVVTSLHERGVRRLPDLFSTFRATTIVLALGTVFTVRNALTYWHHVPLGLPGSSLIRLGQGDADDLRWVTAELSSCESSYSVPGLFSFTFWTGHTLPTAMNINIMLNVIRPAQQEEIVQALSKQPGLCIVYNPTFLRLFDRGQIQSDPPLLHYIQANFAPAADRDGFIILKPRTLGKAAENK